MNLKMRQAKGLTLVEVLVTIGIFAIIAGVFSEVFYQAMVITNISRADVEVYENARGIMNIIQQDLQGAYLDSKGHIFIGVTNSDTGNDAFLIPNGVNDGAAEFETLMKNFPNNLNPESGTLVFTTTSATQDGLSTAKIYYVLKDDGNLYRVKQLVSNVPDTDINNIDYEAAINAVAGGVTFEEAEEYFLLARNVVNISFTYLPRYDFNGDGSLFNGGDWVSSWDPAGAGGGMGHNGVDYGTYYESENVLYSGAPPFVDSDITMTLPRAVEVEIIIKDSKGVFEEFYGGGYSFKTVVTIPTAP